MSACCSVFAGKDAKSVLPTNSLWSLRVWLRTEGVDHQLFKTDELLVGKDLDFNAIGDASFVRCAGSAPDHQVYKGYLGKALVTFTVRCVLVILLNWYESIGLDLAVLRWQRVRDQLYRYSLEYDGGGVGDVLFNDFKMKVEMDPQKVNFLI